MAAAAAEIGLPTESETVLMLDPKNAGMLDLNVVALPDEEPERAVLALLGVTELTEGVGFGEWIMSEFSWASSFL